MSLWYMHSKILEGFYASEVFVSADTEAEAHQLGLQAYDNWLSEYLHSYWNHPLISSYQDDPEYEAEAKAKRAEFAEELSDKLTPVPQSALIFRKT
jgi:hypothetical protein